MFFFFLTIYDEETNCLLSNRNFETEENLKKYKVKRKEGIFLRNIYFKQLLENTNNLCTLKYFYEIFEKFIKVFILIDEKYKHTKKHEWQEIEDQVVENFCTEDCAKYENFHNFFFQPLMNLTLSLPLVTGDP